MDIPRYHTCASLPTCRIYVHPFRNSFGLIDLCRLSRDTRLTSDSCSSGWSFVIGFLHQGRCLPRLARFTRPSPVRADSGLSPHRHTCAAGRTKEEPAFSSADERAGPFWSLQAELWVKSGPEGGVDPRQRARARMLVSDSCLLRGCGNVDERSERSRPGAYRGGRVRPSICRVRP